MNLIMNTSRMLIEWSNKLIQWAVPLTFIFLAKIP